MHYSPSFGRGELVVKLHKILNNKIPDNETFLSTVQRQETKL